MTAGTRRVEGRNGGHWYRLDGEKVDGVTSVLSAGVPKPALPNWAAKETATYAADNIALLGELDRDACIDLLKGSPWRDLNRGARRGTAIHGYAERYLLGEEVDIPDAEIAHVDAYIKFLGDFNVQPVLVEAVLGHRTHRWMGTLDLVADLADGLRWLLDIKTSKSGIFPETALQLAAYRNAEFYLDAYGRERPMLAVQRCAAIWLRADGYDLIPVDASPRRVPHVPTRAADRPLGNRDVEDGDRRRHPTRHRRGVRESRPCHRPAAPSRLVVGGSDAPRRRSGGADR